MTWTVRRSHVVLLIFLPETQATGAERVDTGHMQGLFCRMLPREAACLRGSEAEQRREGTGNAGDTDNDEAFES